MIAPAAGVAAGLSGALSSQSRETGDVPMTALDGSEQDPERGPDTTSGPDAPLSAQVRDTIREGIIRGVYPQGSRLPEAKLAAEMNVSRIPLRAAIPQLQMDGFVRTLPRRGAVVFDWTEDAVNDLFDVRLPLEVAAAGYAARRAHSGMDTTSLLAAIADSHAAIDREDPYEIATTSTLIHQRIVELADNELLTSLMRGVTGRIQWLFFMTSQRDPALACEQHHELHDVIASGNQELAKAVAYAHIEAGRPTSVAEIARQSTMYSARLARATRRS
jgi:DNA-binding GntR family transcriptional regulator